MMDIIIIICRGPLSFSDAFPIVIKVFVVGIALRSFCTTAVFARWASTGVAAVWWLIYSPIPLHKCFAISTGRKDFILRAAVLVEEGRECVYAPNAMVLQLCEKSPVLVLVALGQELPREMGLPLLNLVQPPCQYPVVKRR